MVMLKTETDLLGIVGAGGFGREVSSYATELGLRHTFVETGPSPASGSLSPELFAAEAARNSFVIAIANATVRKRIAEEFRLIGLKAGTLVARSAFVSDQASIDNGAIICPFSCITSNAQIGRHFHSNIYSYVAHDCVIGDYVTFAPGVCCNGNVHIEEGAYIGTGAKIRQGTLGKPVVIGKGAVVGMGAVVLDSVPDGATVVGSPARVIKQA